MPRAGDGLTLAQLQANFAEVPPPLAHDEALVEAGRCVYCFDAPCTRACPTHIDIPKFIRQIMHRHPVGAAKTILEANIFGGSCARACPTEVLCEGACVDNTLLKSPVQIGRLQRHACDTARAAGVTFFRAGEPTGKTVAVIGSGPAGLTCAHELRKKGHGVVVFEALHVAGGMNTLGIAAYKISTAFALSEVELVEEIGLDIRLNHPIRAEDIPRMLEEYDAVFLGIGLGRTMPLRIEGENLPGVWDAIDFVRQTHEGPMADCEVGRHVLVIGGGNTAADASTAAVRLGAESVTVAYRRGEQAMPAFAYEYEYMKADGVRFEWFAQPHRIVAENGAAKGVEFLRTELDDPSSRAGRVKPVPGSEFVIAADMVIKALGQEPHTSILDGLPGLEVKGGVVVIDSATGATSVPGLYAGGDCVSKGAEIVDAVEQGKIAAAGIHNRIIKQ
jgi:glutamate synthase (NADPH/NADH) small chain